jgi:transcriptional regulator with XRE-family HTH domain
MFLDNLSRKKLGSYFKDLRLEKGLSQDQLAKGLGYSNSQFVSNWERGLAHPPLKKLTKLTRVLKADQSEVFKVIMTESQESLARFFDSQKSKR